MALETDTSDEDPKGGLTLGSATPEEEEETGALPYAAVRKAMDARKEAAKARQAYYDDLTAKLAARQAGPSFSERMLQLSSAFFAPTSVRGFSGVMGNVLPVLQKQEQAQREGKIKREDALNALTAAQLGQQEELLGQELETETELAKLMSKRRPIGFNPVTGQKEYMDEITPASVGAAGATDVKSPGTMEKRGGVEGYYNERRVWTPLPQRTEKETFRPATPEEAAMYGAATGQISNLTGKFLPGVAPKPRELKPKEMQMLTDAEQVIATGEQAIRDFTRALELNPTAYSGGLATARKVIGSATSSSDPAYLATEEFSNLTTQNALNALKTTFGGNPTEGERKILLEVQGSIGLPPPARERILRRALGVAQRVVERNKAMIPKIQGGYYSTRSDGSQGKSAAKPRVINWNN
jgi:hypothetical protein